MPQEITLTPDGGFFYRAMTFHWCFVAVAFVPVVFLLIIAILNPFWFRDDFFSWAEGFIGRVSRWRNYQKYKIYLGCDPKVWHGLKDSHE